MNKEVSSKRLFLPLVLLAGMILIAVMMVSGGEELIIGLVAAGAGLLLCHFQPSFVLGCLILSTLLQEVLFVSIGELASLNQAVGIMLLCVSGLRMFIERRVRELFHPITISLILLFVIMIFSYLFLSKGRQAPLQDIDQFIRAFAYFVLCFMVIRKERDLLYIVGAYLVGGLAIAVSGAFWETFVHPIAYFARSRSGIYGITGHYIEYAMRCMIGLPISIYLLLQMRKTSRMMQLILGLCVCVLSMAVLLSGSRGAIIAYGFMVSSIVWLWSSSGFRKAVLCTALIVIPFTLPIESILNSLIVLFRGYLPFDYAANMRLSFLHMLFEHLSPGTAIWGHGLENFRDYYSGNYNPPHNMWGQSFFELGIIGLGIQLYVVWQTIIIFLAVNRNRQRIENKMGRDLIIGLGLSLFVLLFWGLFENVGFLNGSKHLFILLGAFVVGANIVNFKGQES